MLEGPTHPWHNTRRTTDRIFVVDHRLGRSGLEPAVGESHGGVNVLAVVHSTPTELGATRQSVGSPRHARVCFTNAILDRSAQLQGNHELAALDHDDVDDFEGLCRQS